jgi:hypothetical protein
MRIEVFARAIYCEVDLSSSMRTATATAWNIIAVAALGACAHKPVDCVSPPAAGDTVFVVSRGWHVELGLPADQLVGPLASFRTVFPGARAIMFGYGKRTFMTAPADDMREYLLGPVPGPAVIEVVGTKSLPPQAYGMGDQLAVELPAGGAARLDNFIWNDLARDTHGAARLVGPGGFVGSLFYAANSQYNLLHTCNTWAVEALQASGVAVTSVGVILSGQAMSRLGEIVKLQCSTGVAPTAPGG